MQRLVQAMLAIATDLHLPVVLERIASAAVSLAEARYGAVGVIGPDRRLAEFIPVGMDEETIRSIGDPPQGLGLLGTLILDPRPIRVADVSEHPDSYGFPPNHPPMRSFLGLPIRVHGEVFGNLYLAEKIGAAQFTAEDEELVGALAGAAGIAIENARLHQMVGDMAVVEDRERIARDLHDTVIQRVFATGMILQGASRLSQSPEVARRVQQAVDELDVIIREIRTSIFGLGMHLEEEGSIRAAVVSAANEATRILGFAPRVRLSGPIDSAVTAGVGEHLLSTLREALANVGRHAHARSVDVELEVGTDVVLRITDDGTGIPSGVARAGRGLRNMRDRAEALGGLLAVEPGPEGGTVLTWTVPAKPGA